MATFNILSSCICRDAFGFQEKCEHDVITFLQSTSPLTWFQFRDKPVNFLDEKVFENVKNLTSFQKRCIIKDYNKEVLSAYKTDADFFILDFTDFASANLAECIDEQGRSHFFSYTKWFSTAYKNELKEYLPEKMVVHNAVKILQDEKILKETIDKVIEWLLVEKGYKEDQIILVRNKKVSAYTDSEVLVYFDNEYRRNQINSTLDRIYDYFANKMPKCHVIDMPIGTYSDKFHKWGVTDLHFCKDYYDYLYQCFDCIAKEEETQIPKLFYKYSKLLTEKKEQLIRNSFDRVGKENLLSDDLCSVSGNYIVEQGKNFYSRKLEEYKKEGQTNRCFPIVNSEGIYFKISVNNREFYVQSDDCKKGAVGHGTVIGDGSWKLQNQSTLVEIKTKGIVVGHNGSSSKAQMQIISTIKNNERLMGKLVTFSVWTRVLEKNNEGMGGCIAFINANDYNAGTFCAKEEFDNTDWKKIAVSYWVPEGENFRGLTVCLRAFASTDNSMHAKVEFYAPKVQIGSFTIG